MRIYIVSVVAVVVLGGCASVVPEAIRAAAPGNVQIAQVRAQPQQYRDAVVRWGGDIVSTRNERDHTVLEIVGRELDDEGRPRKEDRSFGRFLARVNGFLDPAIYKADREVTVRGRVEGVTEQSIGEFRYTYPLVRVDEIYLWKPLPPAQPRYPYYHDPFFYDPWYPWGWPYYRPWPY
jgi:outer membrane lipoprotein